MVKQKDFRVPFTRETARVTLLDKVIFIPPQCDLEAFTFPGWDHAEAFGNTLPISMEFCSGNGDWIIEKARQYPDINWVATEIRFDRVRKIWSKAKNLNLNNLMIVFGDARIFANKYVPRSSLSMIYVNFPDPWPKKRHAKHRIISDEFFQQTHAMLIPNGTCIFVTDDQDYSDLFLEHAHRFSNTFAFAHSEERIAPPADYGTSFFDSLFRSQGKPILYHELKRL